MIKQILFLLCITLSLFGNMNPIQYNKPPQETEKLIIDNRILTTVRGKTISILDVVKKMDMFISQTKPEIFNSNVSRFQFYRANWRDAFQMIVENELVLADAETLEIKISDGEVRETMQKRFGPNVMETLDKLNIGYEEAKEMIYSDLVVQQMTWFRVNSKVFTSVNPKDVKEAYRQYSAENPPSEEWKYQVISIRGVSEELGNVVANKAFDLLSRAKGEEQLVTLSDTLKQQIEGGLEDSVIAISKEFSVNEKSISEAHKAVLCSMESGTYSKPVTQVSRVDNTLVHRIFYLKERILNNPSSFYEMEDQLQNNLLQNEYSKLMPAYIEKLKERYGVHHEQLEEVTSPNFEPFALM